MLKTVETFPYEIKFGKKIVKFRGWKTRDEKAYLILTESKEELEDKDLYDTLVIPCIENKTMYFTDAELQMLIIEIRKKSLGESFDVKYICKNDKCKTVNDIQVQFDEIVNFKNDTVSNIKIDNMEIFFGDVKNQTLLQERTNDKTNVEKLFIEMVMRIEKLIIDDTVEDTFTYDEITEYIDDLDTKIFDKMIAYYTENLSSISLKGHLMCHRCGHDNEFIFDEIPNFLAGW